MPTYRKQVETQASSMAFHCETLDLGLDGFRECPQTGPSSCQYALPFGYGFLCGHPACDTRGMPAQAKKLAAPQGIDSRRA
jgi:hypothetical protein